MQSILSPRCSTINGNQYVWCQVNRKAKWYQVHFSRTTWEIRHWEIMSFPGDKAEYRPVREWVVTVLLKQRDEEMLLHVQIWCNIHCCLHNNDWYVSYVDTHGTEKADDQQCFWNSSVLAWMLHLFTLLSSWKVDTSLNMNLSTKSSSCAMQCNITTPNLHLLLGLLKRPKCIGTNEGSNPLSIHSFILGASA